MPVLNELAFPDSYVQTPLARYQSIGMVMLTTSLYPADLTRTQQLPTTSFLNKPLTHEKVLRLLQKLFGQ